MGGEGGRNLRDGEEQRVDHDEHRLDPVEERKHAQALRESGLGLAKGEG